MKLSLLASLPLALAAIAIASAAPAQAKFTPAQYDPFVGDWETQPPAAPAAPVAQVIQTGSNAYTVNVLAAFDDDLDAAPIATLKGSLPATADPKKDPIELSGTGASGSGTWTGEMWPDCCSSPHLNLVNTNTQTQARQILRLRHYMRPNPLLRVKPPANAKVLFGINGQNPDAWMKWPPAENNAPAEGRANPPGEPKRGTAQPEASPYPTTTPAANWKLAESGYVLESVPNAGAIASRETFGDQRVHLEFRFIGTPASACVRVQGVYPITLTESYARFDLPPSGVIEKTTKTADINPAARASRPVLEWQSLDVDFHAPKFGSKGKIQTPATATVYLNNVLLYENVELIAPDAARAPETPRGPLVLEERGAPVQFRNIWVQ